MRLTADAHTPDGVVLSWLASHMCPPDSKSAVKRLCRLAYGAQAYRASGEKAEILREMAIAAIGELQLLIYQIGKNFAPDFVSGFDTFVPPVHDTQIKAKLPCSEPEEPDDLFSDCSAEGIDPFA